MKRRREDGSSDTEASERYGASSEAKNNKKNVLKGDNPLARARGTTSQTKSGSNKINRRALQLWHRKSGAGYQLFIQYYTQQADLFQADELDDNTASTGSSFCHGTKECKQSQGEGQSRAAKRRKRKRAKVSKQSSTSDTPNGLAKGEPCNNDTAHLKNITSQQQQHFYSPDGTRLLQTLDEVVGLPQLIRDDFMAFFRAMASPLPLTFRVRQHLSTKETIQQLQRSIQQDFGEWVEPVDSSASFCTPSSTPEATPLSGIFRARTSNASTVLSKTILGRVAPKLKSWLLENSTNGNIARQELGSMLPVLLLSRGRNNKENSHTHGWMKPGSRVLDLCASPGSKTLQALEVVGANGRIKANDINASRLESLREAIQRSNVPNSNRIKYSNIDASLYPIPIEKLFDAIITDVPCSGDGTIRKDSQILPNWTPKTSNALHSLQAKILVRAIQCLKPGGVLCYSTCSLNPVENEAVVAAALNRVGTLKRPAIQAEVIPLPKLVGLKLRPGVIRWKVADYTYGRLDIAKDGNGASDEEDESEVPRLNWYDSFDAATEDGMEHTVPSLWPPSNVKELGLERCGRLSPQDNDCGGFFVALIKRA